MNTQNNRREAIDLALRWTEARGGAQAATSTDLVKAAATIEAYLTGALQVRVVGSNDHGDGGCFPINNGNGLGVNAGDILPVKDVGCAGVRTHKTIGDTLDQSFSGKLVNTHKASSSAQGGEKPERGATLSGAENVMSRCSCDLCRRMHGTRDREAR